MDERAKQDLSSYLDITKINVLRMTKLCPHVLQHKNSAKFVNEKNHFNHFKISKEIQILKLNENLKRLD